MAGNEIHVQCQYGWTDARYETATRRTGVGPNARLFCDPHDIPPCGGTFFGEFVIMPETTREELMEEFEGSSVRVFSASGRDVHDLYCCACGKWIGDALDPDIAHVSEPLDAQCTPDMCWDDGGVWREYWEREDFRATP